MYILKIIPLVKGLPENYLTYFSGEKYSLGSLVEIKIRNKKVFGLILEIDNIAEQKINIKSQKFSLKKIEKQISYNFIKEDLFQSIKESSFLLGVSERELLKNYLPNFLLQKIEIINSKSNIKKSKEKEKLEFSKISPVLGDFDIRHKAYLKEIRKNIKNKNSTTIFFPNIKALEESQKYFEKENIENIIILHSALTPKKIENTLKLLNLETEENKSFLILSTPSLFPFLLKNFLRLNTIILEKENSYNYFTHSAKKQIDFRELVKKVSKDLKLNLMPGGNILSLQTFKELEKKIIKILETENENIKKSKNIELLDFVKEKRDKKEEEFKTRTKKIITKNSNIYNKYSKVYFTSKLIEKLENLRKDKGKIFLYVKRKGLYTETVCSDCNTIYKCKNCNKPYILFKEEKGDRYYICSSCKEKIILKKEEDLICENCSSWNMATLGIAIEGVADNLKEIGFKTFILDSQNIKSKKEINNLLNNWQKEDTSVLLGTELALNFLNKETFIDLAAIVSLDSLFSIPEINIDEKIFNLVLELKEKINSKEKIYIQTRLGEQDIWKYIKKENKLDFLKSELETREFLNLPPYSNILKWTLLKKEVKIKKDLEKIIQKIFKEENLELPEINFKIEKSTGNCIFTLILKKENWEKKEKKEGRNLPTNLTLKLVTLLSDFNLEINPPNSF